MKLTEQHVSEHDLDALIRWASTSDKDLVREVVMVALLELKQRRAEDRQRENDGR
jgi:hypothetical protein